MNAPVKLDALPEWQLSDLYAGRDDPKIEADLAAAKAANDELVKLKGRFVQLRSDPLHLGELLDHGIGLYERAVNGLWAVGAYAALASSVAKDDPAWAKFEGDLRTRSSQIGAESLFFTLELNQLEDNEIEMAFKAHPPAARWRSWMRRVRLSRPHELSPDLERLLIDRSPAVANWVRLYDESLAKLSAKVGKESLSLPEVLNRLSDPDVTRRKAAAQGLAKALEARTPELALSMNTLAFEKQVEDRWRKYPTPAASRHIANEVDADAVEALEAAVVEAYPRVSHRYYALKAKLMGRKTLDYWDRNAPLDTAKPRAYDWKQAQGMVLESFSDLAPKFADTAKTFFDQPWIDARPRAGKQSGAFSHPVTADRHPYVFMNYMGERRDVLTLAHELGHAVHQTLCQPLGTLLADTPLTLAETASIFGEGLVFERLLAGATKAERLGLLAGQIEDGINTVIRQIAFHRFENRFHAARFEGELSAEQIGAIWLETMGESLGPAIKLNEGYEHYWAYVSHFAHAPFYVYAYAFGDLLVRGLMEKRREDPAAFAPLYEDLLAAGGTRTYVEALRPFGLNPREKAFWTAGMTQMERLVDAFEELV
ncbi:MAG: M3 family oligoendopeptidase [Phenylobacterium sp.]|uniref:M3 family oligoendopeptidase n=1 Tax=Phenylobacterium sp. TaxID=1871053 RepID=UPI001B57C7B3|nr:M3 family oligoendopeptidase [Phenylobacterium sp.]MBP7649513.1 M3 family oligoendopeptidase [Phenylobacterium sp.]MBP7816525.1 M3 family oligoendopeptidase [Phenylobacterium sp.]MBP9231210.1 M3 family oligoendopeptidase [Phenylobacterium sp.]MBP9755841.1 M3 family oligoendopeptidase [Phenylobacterium sp.]